MNNGGEIASSMEVKSFLSHMNEDLVKDVEEFEKSTFSGLNDSKSLLDFAEGIKPLICYRRYLTQVGVSFLKGKVHYAQVSLSIAGSFTRQ